MWTCFGIISFGLVCTVVMGDETFYPRHLPPAEIPKRKSRLLSLIGVEQVRTNWTTNNCVEAGSRLGRTLAKLPVLLTCLYYFIDCKQTTLPEFLTEQVSPMDYWHQPNHICLHRSRLPLQLRQSSCHVHCSSCRCPSSPDLRSLHLRRHRNDLCEVSPGPFGT